MKARNFSRHATADSARAIRLVEACAKACGRTENDVFRDCVRAIFARLSGERFPGTEKYPAGLPVADVAECLVRYREGTGLEMLSTLYMEFSADAGLGQDFTPWHIVDKVIDPLFETLPEGDKPVMILEPAVGCGRFIVAAARKLRERGRTGYFIGVDIDPDAVKACAVNCALFGINAVLLCGNWLTERYESALECVPGEIRKLDSAAMGKVAKYISTNGKTS